MDTIPSNSSFNATFYTNPPCHIVLHNNGSVFTSPIEPCDLPIPQPDVHHPNDWITLDEAFQFRWNLSKYPQFAFIPRHIQFLGPLLGRLAHYKIVLSREGRYQLEPQLLKSWISLEDTLTAAISCLSSGFLLPMDVEFFAYPSEYKYKRSYKTHYMAKRAIQMSRDAFVVLIGLFSMFYSLRAEQYFRFITRPNATRVPTIQQLFKDFGFLSDTTVQDLMDMHNILGSRIGLVVNPGSCEWFIQCRYALAFSGVRFWVHWGIVSEKLVPTWRYRLDKMSPFFYFIPDHDRLGRCVYFIKKLNWPSISSRLLAELEEQRCQSMRQIHPPDIEPEIPEPIPTVQKTRESPLQFLARRQKEAEGKKEAASSVDLQRFASWAKESVRLGWTRKSKVYHWPMIGGVRRRTLVERKEIEYCWESTQDSKDRTPGQRKFNDVFNEWDICTEFDPQEEPPQMEERSSSSSPSPKPTIIRSELVSTRLTTKPLHPNHDKQALVFSHATGIDDQEIITPELDVVLYERYGFDVGSIASALKDGILPPLENPLSIEDIAKVLMEKNAVASKSSGRGTCHLVTLITRGSPVPDQFWDLKNSELRINNPGYFTFTALKLTCDETAKCLDGYIVMPTSELYRKPWVLFIESAIAVTQCIRAGWGPSLEDVVQETCQRGYRIHLFIKEKPTIPRRLFPPTLFSPRVRSGNFIPSHFDFHAYQDNVKLLLMQQRVRAAALRGGLLGRICSPYITLDDLVEGPSPDVLRYGLRWKSQARDFVYIEDFVSEDEIRLLCGFFTLDCSTTGGRVGQTKLVSFFPSPNVWENSGIHPGIWSNSGEEKFKAIVKKLDPEVGRDSYEPISVPVKSTDQWKSHLRLHVKPTKNFLAFVETQAHVFLSTL